MKELMLSGAEVFLSIYSNILNIPPGQKAQHMQRPWGRRGPGRLEERRGHCAGSRAREGEGGRGRGSRRAWWVTTRTLAFVVSEVGAREGAERNRDVVSLNFSQGSGLAAIWR